MVGRQARQVVLDQNNKIVYSVADTGFSRTGVSAGVGFPELCCDERHAHVLLPCVSAIMKKVPQRSPDRDQIHASFLRCAKFCELMLSHCSDGDDVMEARLDGSRSHGPKLRGFKLESLHFFKQA